MRQVAVKLYCDRHFEKDGSRVEGETTPPIAIGRGAAKTLELCSSCRAELIPDELLDLLAGRGETPHSAPPPAPTTREKRKARIEDEDRWDCPFCPANIKRRGAPSHLRMSHRAQVEEQPTQCPDCDFATNEATGMRVHRVRLHGFDQTAAYVEQIRERERQKKVPRKAARG